MSAPDSALLARYPEARTAALAAVQSGADAAARELVDRVLAPPARSLEGFGLEGEWHCRVLRIAGEPARLEVNGWFTCSLADDGAGLALVKESGSWRTRGRFFDLGQNRMAYLGSRGVGGDAGRRGEDPARDHFGVAAAAGPGRLRVEFPPRNGEDWLLEVLEVRRAARAAKDLCTPEMPTVFACPHARSGTLAAICAGQGGPVLRVAREGVVELELPGIDGDEAPTLLREQEPGGELKGVAFARGDWRYVMSHFVGGRPVQASTLLSIRDREAPAIALPCAVPFREAEKLATYFERLDSAQR